MVETAIDASGAKIPAHVIHNILRMGQDMLNHPIRLLPGVAESLPKLAESYHIVLITKGDLLHQEQKLAQSGLGNSFDDVQIVSEKEPQTYRRIFGGDAPRATMVGNSIKSDIVPALEIGAATIYIPTRYGWYMEKADPPTSHSRFHKSIRFQDILEILPQI